MLTIIYEYISGGLFYLGFGYFCCGFVFAGLRLFFSKIKLESVGVVAREIVICHFSGFEEAELGVEAKGSFIDTFGLKYNFMYFIFHSKDEFVEQFFAYFVSSVFFEYN